MFIKKQYKKFLLALSVIAIITGVLAFNRFPELQMKTSLVLTWIRGALQSAGTLPTAEPAKLKTTELTPFWLPDLMGAQSDSSAAKTTLPTQSRKIDLPAAFSLAAPYFDKHKDYQDWNNCGPATLALALRFWAWQGDQFTISAAVRSNRQDKNVNIEELAAYVNTSAEGVRAEVRVGGDQNLLETLIAGGYPVLIEEAFKVEKSAWPGDDQWAGHYLLLTGYDNHAQRFTAQDSYYGPDQLIAYDKLAKDWQAFDHLYLVIFPIGDQPKMQKLLGEDWDPSANLNRTAALLQNELQAEPGNAFAWFNLGSTLVAQKDFTSAVAAFDKARGLGLPQRMLRYQFGPFVAAYQTGDQKDLMRLADYALQITPDSEEALLWKGWAYEMAGDHLSAISLFNKALEANPGNQEAQKALLTVRP